MLKRTAAIVKQARELHAREQEPPYPWDRLAPATQDEFIARIYERLKHGAVANAKLPTIREEPRDNECYRAQWWRKNIMRLKRDQLASLTGYTVQTISLMERGIASSGALTSEWVWRRYKLTCHGIHAQLRGWPPGVEFDWAMPGKDALGAKYERPVPDPPQWEEANVA